MSPPETSSGDVATDVVARPRASRGSLTREHVVDVAVSLVRAGRYEEMSIRALAAELGVAPMSLYRHIRDRDDLLDEITDRLLAESWRPSASSDDWREWIVEAALRLRELLVSQPAVLHTYLAHPVTTGAARERMRTVLEVLASAGLSEDAAQRTFAALHTYTVGFSALEASRSKRASASEAEDAAAAHLATFTTTEQFLSGLQMLLAGAESIGRDETGHSSASPR